MQGVLYFGYVKLWYFVVTDVIGDTLCRVMFVMNFADLIVGLTLGDTVSILIRRDQFE